MTSCFLSRTPAGLQPRSWTSRHKARRNRTDGCGCASLIGPSAALDYNHRRPDGTLHHFLLCSSWKHEAEMGRMLMRPTADRCCSHLTSAALFMWTLLTFNGAFDATHCVCLSFSPILPWRTRKPSRCQIKRETNELIQVFSLQNLPVRRSASDNNFMNYKIVFIFICLFLI